MKNAIAVFKREFKAYFDSPVAYVFLVAFLALIGFMTFAVAMFYERRQALLGLSAVCQVPARVKSRRRHDS